MKKIKTVIFDLGGVIMTIDPEEALRRFKEIGLKDAEKYLDAYTQGGIFGDLEAGAITTEQFRAEFSRLAGKEVSLEECAYAWLGYRKEVPQRNLEALLKLKSEGYRVVLLSNTNAFMMAWAMSKDFDGNGHPLSYYVDEAYLSYKMKVMKPELSFFKRVIEAEGAEPQQTLFVDDGERNVSAAAQLGINTFQPENGSDWTKEIYNYL